VNWRKLPN